jgi:hypothetical protein
MQRTPHRRKLTRMVKTAVPPVRGCARSAVPVRPDARFMPCNSVTVTTLRLCNGVSINADDEGVERVMLHRQRKRLGQRPVTVIVSEQEIDFFWHIVTSFPGKTLDRPGGRCHSSSPTQRYSAGSDQTGSMVKIPIFQPCAVAAKASQPFPARVCCCFRQRRLLYAAIAGLSVLLCRVH